MIRKGVLFSLVAGAYLVCASSAAVAQEQKGISFGQLKLLLTAGLSWAHDDNITLSSQESIQNSSDFYVFSPGIRLEAPTDRSIFALTWSGEAGRYKDSKADDYDTWRLRGTWGYDPTSRTGIGLFAEIRDDRDRRGEGRTQGDAGLTEFEPDEYDLISYGGHFDYGAVGSRGRLELSVNLNELEYTNNREFTRFLDRDDSNLLATFFMRIRPKTSLLAGVGYTDVNYLNEQFGSPSPDSSEERFFVGLTWDVSARTNGRLDYGRQTKDFDDPLRESYSGNFWRARVSWQPRTYSTFSLVATKETDESSGFGDYVLRQDISLDWVHQWSTRFSTSVDFGTGTDEFLPGIREDDLEYWGISARWQLNRNLQIGLGFNDYSRRSNDGEFSYDRQVWMLTLEGSL